MAIPAPFGAAPADEILIVDENLDHSMSPRGSAAWRHLRRNPAFWIGAAAVLVIVTGAAAAPLLAPYDPNFAIRGSGLVDGHAVGPSSEFWLGTDRLGRDYFSRLLHGARTSLLVALSATTVAAVLGTTVGMVAALAGTRRVRVGGRRRGFDLVLPVEGLLMRLTDAFLSFPTLLLAIALAALFGASLLLLSVVIAGLLWTTTARVVYSQTRAILTLDFIDASRALGVGHRRLLLRHVLPHMLPLVVVYTTLGIAAVVLFESILSFLGAGVPAPAASWGTMISEHASYYRTDPRLLLLPGAAIAVTTLAFNLLGDALGDALDPRLSSLA
ncbi:MAG: ABC transporter permease [Candidatus Limnocylindria bacterium]